MPDLFNDHGFGPPDPFTGRSACPRVDHGVSGRTHTTKIALLTLAFASAPSVFDLALPNTCTRRPIMQKVRRHPLRLRAIGLRQLVSVRFQVLLTRLVAVLFIVRSPYSFTIGHRGVFSLGRWAGQLRAGFHEPRATLVRLSTLNFTRRLRGCHPLWPAVPGRSTELSSARGARNPGPRAGLGCSVFARRYWRNRCLFLLLRVLRCFSSPRSLYPPYAFGRESPPRWWGFPIRKSLGQRSFASSPRLIAGCRVLRRLSMPRHPPYTLKSLATVTDHRRARAWHDAGRGRTPGGVDLRPGP